MKQLNKYTAQFEVDRLKMEKLELSEKMRRERLAFDVWGGLCDITAIVLVTYHFIFVLFP